MRRPVPGPRRRQTDFGGLDIAWDERVLQPRQWTLAQSRWAAELLQEVPPGPVLELCCGAGHIGLRAVADSGRSLVCVDANPAAAAFARENAAAAGLADRVEVRTGWIDEVVDEGELFSLIVADPPWVPRADTARFPHDPALAIDGGDDGLDVVRICVTAIQEHLAPGGCALLQLGTSEQARQVESLATRVRSTELRTYERGVVQRLG